MKPGKPSGSDPSGDRMDQVLREAGAFFGGTSPVHRAAAKIARALEDLAVDYAVAGALAVNFYGRPRMTEDVAVLVTRTGLERFKEANVGRGYVEKFAGSKGVRDAENKVAIDFLVTGDYPGDGKPKSVRFPDPSKVAVPMPDCRVLSLPTLIELKLASGLSAPDRLRDLADVLDLIRARGLSESFAEELDPYVRPKYLELWRVAREKSGE